MPPALTKAHDTASRRTARLVNDFATAVREVSDHSTPAAMGQHSWHPVPFLIHAPYVRPDAVDRFNEAASLQGGYGLRPGVHLMGLVLANAGKLAKFGA